MSGGGYGSTLSSPVTTYSTSKDIFTSGINVLAPPTEHDEPRDVQNRNIRDESSEVAPKQQSSRSCVQPNQTLPSFLRLCLTSFSLRGLRRSRVHRRLPSNRNVWLVFIMFFLQGFAEFSSLIFLFFCLDAYGPLNPPEIVALYLLIQCLMLTASPFVGLLADAYFGRYSTIKACLYTSLVGAVALAIGFSTKLDPYLSEDAHYEQIDLEGTERWPVGAVVFIGVTYSVLMVGFTGVTVNLIPFGADQLPEASSGEFSSYFHCYFWFFTAGRLLGATIIPYIYECYSLGTVFLLPAACFTGEIVILILNRHEGFVIQPLIGNQIKLIYRVLKCSFTAKKPVFRSAFDVGRPPPSRIDRAMVINGGKFTVEQVEDVKTVLRILMILLSFFGYYAVSAQLVTTYLLEGIRMTVPEGTYTDCTEMLYSSTHFFDNFNYSVECHEWRIPPPLWMTTTSIIPTLILIPLVDRLLYVSCRPKMLKRIAAGKVFLLLSIVVAIPVEIVRMTQLWDQFDNKENNSTIIINAIPFHTKSSMTFHVASPLSIAFIMPQYILFGFTVVLAKITVVEFIYAQSPGAMKGLLLGMLFFTNGMAMGFSSLLIYLQNPAPKFHFPSYFGNSKANVMDNLDCLSDGSNCVNGPLFSYVILAVTVLLSGVVFIIAAYKYTLRRRDVEPFNPLQ